MAPAQQSLLFMCMLVAIVVTIAQEAIVINYTFKSLPFPDNRFNISGRVYCSANGSATVDANGVIVSPPFANATIQYRCGRGAPGTGFPTATTVTNSSGQFSFLFTPAQYWAALTLGGRCFVVLVTPLGSCEPATNFEANVSSYLIND